MNQDNNIADKVSNGKIKVNDMIRSRAFDLVAAGIVVAMAALTLGVLELRTISWLELVNILLETLPFYLANLLLTINFYNKGVFAGKATKAFVSVVTAYSAAVNALTGQQIRQMSTFCAEYNEHVLTEIQTRLLKTVALSFYEFDKDYVEHDAHSGKDVSHGPLKALNKSELEHLLGTERAKVVINAKNVKIKGIRENLLLGNIDNEDVTDLGPDERSMSRSRRISYSITGFISVLLLTLIGVKNIMEWGWIGLFFMIFKLLYIVCASYLKYFEGYQDITNRLSNHISRKHDILKEFKSWEIERSTLKKD